MKGFNSLQIFLLMLLLSELLSKPLTKDTIEYLKADQDIFDTFHHRLRMLGCKLGSYSKIKDLYDREIIDQYLNKTRYKRTFLNALEAHFRQLCEEKIVDDKLIFNETIVTKYDNNIHFEELIKGYNITQVLLLVNDKKQTEEKKEEL